MGFLAAAIMLACHLCAARPHPMCRVLVNGWCARLKRHPSLSWSADRPCCCHRHHAGRKRESAQFQLGGSRSQFLVPRLLAGLTSGEGQMGSRPATGRPPPRPWVRGDVPRVGGRLAPSIPRLVRPRPRWNGTERPSPTPPEGPGSRGGRRGMRSRSLTV